MSQILEHLLFIVDWQFITSVKNGVCLLALWVSLSRGSFCAFMSSFFKLNHAFILKKGRLCAEG
jgi:hypothetical protein